MEQAYSFISSLKVANLIYYGMRALVLVAAMLFFFEGNWAAALNTFFIFLLMLLPSFLRQKYRLQEAYAIDFGLVTFLFLTLFLGDIGAFYEHVPFWDKFLHLQSGLVLGASGFVIVYLLNEYKRDELHLSPAFLSIFAIVFSLAIGTIWEIFEFSADTISSSPYWQHSLTDTMWDLIADFIGALIVSIPGYFWMRRHMKLPFTPGLIRFFNISKLAFRNNQVRITSRKRDIKDESRL